MTGLIVVALVSYAAGAIPFSLWAGRIFAGINLREHGSGNLGASNAFRFLGARIATGVLIADIAKGFLPVYFAPAMGGGQGVADHWVMLVAAFATVIGHMFSVFVRFRGGKGIATTSGAFLAIAPWALLGAFAVFAAVVVPTRIISLGSIAGSICLPAIVYLVNRFGLASYHWSVLALSVVIMVVVIIKHTSNIRRLLAGRERGLQREKF